MWPQRFRRGNLYCFSLSPLAFPSVGRTDEKTRLSCSITFLYSISKNLLTGRTQILANTSLNCFFKSTSWCPLYESLRLLRLLEVMSPCPLCLPPLPPRLPLLSLRLPRPPICPLSHTHSSSKCRRRRQTGLECPLPSHNITHMHACHTHAHARTHVRTSARMYSPCISNSPQPTRGSTNVIVHDFMNFQTRGW